MRAIFLRAMMVLRNLGGARYLLHLRGRRNCCRHHRPRFLRDGPAASAAPQLEARAREWRWSEAARDVRRAARADRARSAARRRCRDRGTQPAGMHDGGSRGPRDSSSPVNSEVTSNRLAEFRAFHFLDVFLPLLDHQPGEVVRDRLRSDRAEHLLRDAVAPVAEGALRELHDVALVHQRDALALVLYRVADRAVHQPLGAEVADGLETDAHFHRRLALRRTDPFQLLLPGRAGVPGAEADFFELLGKLPGPEIEDLLALRRARGVLDAGVDVLRVLAEDHHVDLVRPLDRAGDAFEPAHRAQADEEVEHLPQRDVEGADPTSHGGREGALDSDQILAERFDGLVRKPVVEQVLALLAGVDLHPGDPAPAAVCLLDRCIEDALRRTPDVRTRSISFDERQDRLIRDAEAAARNSDGLAVLRDLRRWAGHVSAPVRGARNIAPAQPRVQGRFCGGKEPGTSVQRQPRRNTHSPLPDREAVTIVARSGGCAMQLEFQCQKCEESFSMDVSDIQGDPVLRCPGCGTRAPDEQVEAIVSGLEELFAALAPLRRKFTASVEVI